MSETIVGRFDSRRSADLAIEHLVQEHGIERTDIFVQTASNENSSGVTAAGADAQSGHPGVDKSASPALEGTIEVSVDINDADADLVRATLAEAGGTLTSS